MSQPVGRRGIADSWPKNERCTYCGNLFGEHPIQSGEQICHGQRLELTPIDNVKPYTREEFAAFWGDRFGWMATAGSHHKSAFLTEAEAARVAATVRAGLEEPNEEEARAAYSAYCTEYNHWQYPSANVSGVEWDGWTKAFQRILAAFVRSRSGQSANDG